MGTLSALLWCTKEAAIDQACAAHRHGSQGMADTANQKTPDCTDLLALTVGSTARHSSTPHSNRPLPLQRLEGAREQPRYKIVGVSPPPSQHYKARADCASSSCIGESCNWSGESCLHLQLHSHLQLVQPASAHSEAAALPQRSGDRWSFTGKAWLSRSGTTSVAREYSSSRRRSFSGGRLFRPAELI